MVGRLERGAQECEARLGQHAVEVIREPDGVFPAEHHRRLDREHVVEGGVGAGQHPELFQALGHIRRLRGGRLQRFAAGADTPGFPTKWFPFEPKIVTSFLYALFVAGAKREKHSQLQYLYAPDTGSPSGTRVAHSDPIKIGQRTIVT